MREVARGVLAVVVCASVAVMVVLASGGVSEQSDRDAPKRADDRPRRLGMTDGHDQIDFSLVLRMRSSALRRYVRSVTDPRSPGYGRSLGAPELGERFGPDRDALARTRRLLRAAGVRVVHSYPHRASLRVRGPADRVERLLGVRLADYVAPSGRRYHAPLGPPKLPDSLRDTVRDVAGLSTRPVVRPAAVREGGMKPADVAAAYNIRPLDQAGIRGQGQTVAIMSFDSFHEEDVELFDRLTGTDGPAVRKVPVDGGATVGDGTVEVNLDIDTVRTIAPNAQILDYESDDLSGGGFANMVDQIVADGRADIVSLSWGWCDAPDQIPAGDRRRLLQSLEAAAARGISVFEASGDWGAYDCQNADPGDQRLAVDFPASSPDIVTVGGTLLSVRRDGTYLEEAAWEDVISGDSTGGGLAPREPRPAYQRGRGVDNEFSNGRRQIPDVAGPADPDSGIFIVVNGEEQVGGGTSQSAPFWAGAMALVRQHVRRETGRRGLGYVNPALYELARRDARGRVFHDVVKGGNLFHNATPGWDYATGWGSPDVFELAKGMAELSARARDSR